MEDERKDLCLQWALEAPFLGEGRGAAPFLGERAERWHPSPPRIHRRLDRRDVEDLSLRRPLEAAPERPIADRAGEVDEGPRGARARNAIHRPTLIAPRRPYAVEANPVDLATPLGRGNHVDYDRAFVEQPE